ncbi:4'-phosphopantetheinyl transferase family protein [Streptomyces sp. NRAIS4]
MTSPAPLRRPEPVSHSAAPVQLWFCPNEALAPAVADVLSTHWLDEQELQTAGRFLFDRDRRQYLVAHALVRRVLALESGIPEAEAVLWRSSRGRPFLRKPVDGLPRGGRELDFNLSHADGYNLLGVVRHHRIGVDVERLDRGDRGYDVIVESFAPEEIAWVAEAAPGRDRDRRTLRLWTLKEAYAKARGLGLGLAFDSFAFTLGRDRGVLAFRPPDGEPPGQWRFAELEPEPGVLVAVAVMTGPDEDAVLDLHHGFPWSRQAPRRLSLPQPVGAPV